MQARGKGKARGNLKVYLLHKAALKAALEALDPSPGTQGLEAALQASRRSGSGSALSFSFLYPFCA